MTQQSLLINPEPLEPMCFPLHGNRLIEASAGTGKTFTIASLYLRLLLGHGEAQTRFPRELTVDQILVVTFTEAATAELRDRIRRRIHDARLAFSRGRSDDPVIKPLLEDIGDHKAAAAILLQAERQMDEAAIFTIHGFCQRMLTQNAFESGSLFNNEFVTEESHLRAQVVADFWRRNFYPLPRSLAAEVRKLWAAPEALLPEINRFLSGAEITVRAPQLTGSLEQVHEENLQRISHVKRLWRDSAGDLHDIIASSGVNKRSYTKTSLPKALAEVGEWAERDNTGYQLPKALDKFDQQVLFDKTSKGQPPEHPVFVAIGELLANKPTIRDPLLAHAIKECRQLLLEAKQRKGWLSFDDLLTQLSAALSQDDSGLLASRIRHLFPVAMIDEFQDTDPLQYSIFSTIYGEQRQAAELPEGELSPCGLFMIGDPKQAIYAFRGADIFTYIQARRQVTAHYTLGTNWRSTAEMVGAVNRIFQHPERPFIYDEDITFLPVDHSPKAQGRGWQLDGMKQPAMCFWHQEAEEPTKKGDYQQVMAEATTAEIQKILTLSQQGKAVLVDGEQTRPIHASDISVLVRTGSEAALIRRTLAEQGIASVYLSNRDSVFGCTEAADLLRFLQAVLTPEDDRNMRAALASSLFGLTAQALDAMNTSESVWEQYVSEFRVYRKLWQSRGVLPMLRHMLAQRKIPETLLSQNGGERRVTDILHIGELLQQASQTLDSDHGLLRWLAEHIEAPNGNADEQQLRLESDRNLVQIVTIHKSKGLEYDIVFLPFVCSYREANTALFHDDQSQQSVLDIAASEESMELAEKERLAEDLRLLYVALTRAVYGCYIGMSPIRNGLSRKEPTGLHRSAIGWLVQNAQEGGMAELANALAALASQSEAVTVLPPPPLPDTPWLPAEEDKPLLSASVFDKEIDRSWWITSYSGLIKQGHSHHDASFELPGFDTDSSGDEALGDEDVEPARTIYTFPKGARPGTFLHTLFEEIEFTAPVDSPETTGKILELLRLENYDEEWLPVLQTMIRDVLTCPLDGEAIRLGEIPPSQRLTEMEFMLPINLLSAPLLNKAIARHDNLSAKAGELGFATVSGMLKGFIDLVFEHHGRYYVLDWKSNFLGEEPNLYRGDMLDQAMVEHRYDLQYQLYALALHRFLKSRKADYNYDDHFGGVYYLFLRGVKAGSDSGIFRAKPSLALLTELETLIDGESPDA
ncbi:exodeoxyribonuclease V subunit beta [Photobacterium gaetbulicola]|uniref:RecBCD enzyme subunit RecB n=1 Tax=Photobacterium gaetbulicola TaxID=1295392 RepID=A0A0B9GEB6_9GAMM|nr:exodeoxyribonuclease V subunit beta [Photobacterium gaetbulicola]KHT63130.1 exodeoxyribonuclease V subunit beta [Photobacterium gaetbulicola]